MKKRMLISSAVLGCFLVLAFGSNKEAMEQIQAEIEKAQAGGGGGGGNAAACRNYVETYNSLPCMGSIKLKADDICPAMLDQSPIDMTGYYDCMAENSKCNGNIPDLSGVADCKMPTM